MNETMNTCFEIHWLDGTERKYHTKKCRSFFCGIEWETDPDPISKFKEGEANPSQESEG